MKKIGLTTTAPIEVLIAAGYTPIDINNLFITSNNYLDYIEFAEKDGFPNNSCAWIKGIYGACIANGIKEIVGIVEGDCSNTTALLDVLKYKGLKVYSFSYPHSHELDDVKKEINDFIKLFDTDIKSVEVFRDSLKKVRKLAKEIDELTYRENKISGFENHLYQLCMSDFNGDAVNYEMELLKLKELAKERLPFNQKIRLGFIGVPPMTIDIFDYVEMFDARFVYNEVQREFAFPRVEKALTIYDQYYDYTYPYDLDFRLNEIKSQINERNIDGIIHYTQASCYRAIDDIVIKKSIDIPILTIEGDKLNALDARTKLRLEAFLDMLMDLKGGRNEDTRS